MKTWLGNFLSDIGVLVSRVLQWAWNNADGVLIIGFFLTLFLGTTVLIVNVATASSQVTFCTMHNQWQYNVAGSVQSFNIIGHKDWRPDVTVATVGHIEEALALLDTDACHPH